MMKKQIVNIKSALAALLFLLAAVYYFSPSWLAKAGLSFERRHAGLAVESVIVGNERISYLSGGTGPDMVLVHGFGGSKDNYTRFARYLTKDYHVIIPDLTGFGDSTKDMTVSYDVFAQTSRLHAFIRQLHLQSFHLAGHSMGGGIAGAFAAKYPEMVKSLLLLAPAGVTGAPESEFFRILKKGDNPFIITDSADFDKLMGLAFYHKPFIPRPVRLMYANELAANQSLMKKVLTDLKSVPFSLADQIRQYPGLILVIWGAQDRIVDDGGGEILEKACPGLVLKILPDCGHMPMMEWPKETAADYLAFLKRAAWAGKQP